MKDILKGIGVVLLTLFLWGVAQANDMPDLEGAELKDHGVCVYNGQPFQCAVYELKGTKYVLYASGRDLILIYRVKKDATAPYGTGDMDLIWSKKPKGTTV